MIEFITAIITFTSMVAVLAIFMWFNKTQCYDRWDSAYWTWTSGCMVGTEHGYIPEANYRIID